MSLRKAYMKSISFIMSLLFLLCTIPNYSVHVFASEPEELGILSDVTNLQWVEDSAATISWDAVDDANYYDITVAVYENDGETLIGSTETGTSSTELDVQQEIHDVIGDSEYESVKVEVLVCAQKKADDVVVAQSNSLASDLWTYITETLKRLPTPTNVRFLDDYTLKFDCDLDNPEEDVAEVILYICIEQKDPVYRFNQYIGPRNYIWEDGTCTIGSIENSIFDIYKGKPFIGEVDVCCSAYIVPQNSGNYNYESFHSELSNTVKYTGQGVRRLPTPTDVHLADDYTVEFNCGFTNPADVVSYVCVNIIISQKESGRSISKEYGNYIPTFIGEDGSCRVNIRNELSELYRSQFEGDVDVCCCVGTRTVERDKEYNAKSFLSESSNTVTYSEELRSLPTPTNLQLFEGYILQFDCDLDNPEDEVKEMYITAKMKDETGEWWCPILCTSGIEWEDGKCRVDIEKGLLRYYNDYFTGEIKVSLAIRLYPKETGNYNVRSNYSAYSDWVSYIPRKNPETISLAPSAPIICKNHSYYLGKTIDPVDAYYENIDWSSDDENIVTVSDEGKITGVSVGTANITATIGDVTATVSVSVYEISSNIEDEEDQQEITDTAGDIIDDIANNDDPNLDNTDIDPDDVDDIKDEIHDAIENGDTFHTDIVFIQQYFDTYKKNWGQIQKAARELNAQFEGAYDIQVEMYHKDKDDNTHHIGNIIELENEITFTFDLPTGMKEQQSGNTKKYVLVRIHKNSNGETEYSPVDYTINDDGTFTASSDLYSDFVWLSAPLDGPEIMDDVTNLQWVEDSSATLSWDAVEDANYYAVTVNVYETDGETLIGSTETGTTDTELDVQQEIHDVIGIKDYDEVKVAATVCAQKKLDDVVVAQSQGESTGLITYFMTPMVRLPNPTNVNLSEDYILEFDYDLDDPQNQVMAISVEMSLKEGGHAQATYSTSFLYGSVVWNGGKCRLNVEDFIKGSQRDYARRYDYVGPTKVTCFVKLRAKGDYFDSKNTSSNTVEFESLSFKTPESISVAPSEPIVCKGHSYYLGKTIDPVDAHYESIDWSSDDESMVTVSDEGKITGISVGTAHVTAAIGSVTATVPVSVYEISSNIEDEEDQQEVTDTAGDIIDDIANNDDPNLDNTDIDPDDVDDIKDEIHDAIENGDTFHTDIVFIQQYFDTYKKNWGQIQKAARELNAQFEGAYDIQVEMYHKDKDDNTHHIGNIIELENEITFTFDLPTGMKEQQSGNTKKYVLVRIHKNSNGETEYSPVDYTINDDGTFTASSDLYSDFVWLSAPLDGPEIMDDVTNLQWVEDSSATLSWDAVEDANYYAVTVNVYETDGETLIGSAETGTVGTGLDILQIVHNVVGNAEYDAVKVAVTVCAQKKQEETVIAQSFGLTSEQKEIQVSTYVQVSFDPGEGTVDETSRMVKTGTPYGALPIPYRKGFEFDGWQNENNVSVTADTVVNILIDHTLTAKWSAATKGIRLDYDSLSLTVKETKQITANLLPLGLDNEITWASSEPAIASVDAGLITALASGTARITATTLDGVSASCNVLITQPDTVHEEELNETFDIPDGLWIAGMETAYPYTGDKITPEPRVYFGSTLLRNGSEYKLSYKNNTNAGTATLIITGNGDYAGKCTKLFEIVPVELEQEDVDVVAGVEGNGRSAIKPSVVVTHNGKTLKENKDYQITYEPIYSMGTTEVTVTGIGNYTGELDPIDFVVCAKGTPSLKNATVLGLEKSYTLAEIRALITDPSRLSVKNMDPLDYQFKFEGCDRVGKGTLVVLPSGNGVYTGEKRVNLTITGTKLGSLVLGSGEITYDATSQRPNISVYTGTKGSGTLIDPENYDVKYSTDTKKAGTITVTVTAKSEKGYTGSVSAKLKVKPCPITDEKVSILMPDGILFAQGGTMPSPLVTYTNGIQSWTLREGVDYTVKYANNKAVSGNKTPTYTITGKGNFTGSTPATPFVISKRNINTLSVACADIAANQAKKGKYYLSKPVIYDVNGKALKENTDYTVTYTNLTTGKEIGKQEIVPSGTKIKASIVAKEINYTGKTEVVYRVTDVAKNIANATVGKIPDQYYNGKPIELQNLPLTFTTGNGRNKETINLVKDTDYRITSYYNNVKKGTASLRIEGKGEYTGSKIINFKIVAANNALSWKGLLSGENLVGFDPTSISLEDQTIPVGTKRQLVPTFAPEGCDIPELVWKSSNPQCVSVDKYGNITAKKTGTVTITVTLATNSTVSTRVKITIQ